ncbi:MAG TPA: right-handed parallel beta-helix repeat-containing protein [Blastocatellia bacterium]|nr:right-handed parallel beta-helix repeat-containing protein [Blastocatellia bacterium]
MGFIRSLFTALLIVVTLLAPSAATKSFETDFISVTTSEDLQAALDRAKPGDVITIEAGATLVGNFVLPDKGRGGREDWITIRSSATDESLPPGARVTPAQSAFMPKLVSPNSEPALRTSPRAHHYRMIGIELTIASEVMLNHGIVRLGGGDEKEMDLLPSNIAIDRCYIHGHALADVSRAIALNSASTDIIDSYLSDIHGLGFDTQAICGWNGPGPFRIINNYLEAAGENVLFGGADPKIPGLVPEDIEFRRNDCSKPLSWQEGILAAPAGITSSASFSTDGQLLSGTTYYYRVAARARAGFGSVATSKASDEIAVMPDAGLNAIEIGWQPVEHASAYRVYRTNDPPEAESRRWVHTDVEATSFADAGNVTGQADGAVPPRNATRWSVKNLFELKNARRVTIDGNLFENNWVDAQSGFAILFTVRNQDGTAPWSVTEDIQFTNNIVRHSAGGVNILGQDDLHPSDKAKRIEIKNNLFDDIGGARWGTNGRFLQITDSADVSVVNNTVIHTGNIITAYGRPNSAFVFINNLMQNNEYGVVGDNSQSGKVTIERYLPESVFKKNAIIGGQSAIYPKKNFFPPSLDEVGFVDLAAGNYRLAATSAYRFAGVKGRDVGADIDAIEAARSGRSAADR